MKSTYIIPEWKDIRLVDYLKFHNKLKPYENTDLYSEKLLQYVCSIFFKIPVNDIRELPESTLQQLTEYSQDLIIASKEAPLVKSFTLKVPHSDNVIKLGFIPDLESMSYGEYLDLSVLCKDTWENIAEIMTILYRPIVKEQGNKYEIAKYSKRDESVIKLFENSLTMDVVFGALSFFFRLQNQLTNNFLHSFKETLQDPEVISQLKEHLQQNGEAMELLSSLQMETQQS